MTAKEFGTKAKEWAANHPKTMRFGKALLAGAVKTITTDDGAPSLPAVAQNTVLDAKQVEALVGMSSWQLERIFKGKQATFASDPATLKAVSRLSSWQIDAILDLED